MKKLAMIGCGNIGHYHLGHFLQWNDIELAGFCDLILERAQDCVDQAKSGKAFTCWKAMLDEVQPDMIFICIPPYARGEMELECVKRRIPMFVEKPMGLDMDMVYRIRDEIDKAHLITAVGFQCRYASIIEPTKEFAKKHRIAYVHCGRIGKVSGNPWYHIKRLSGGQIVEQTIHNFDLIRYILGEPSQVFTMGTRAFVKGAPNYDTEDLSTTTIAFENGALGTVATGHLAENGACCDNNITFSAPDARLKHYIISKIQIYGEEAKQEEKDGLVVSDDGAVAAAKDYLEIKDDGKAGERCDRTFVDAVLTGDPSKIRSPYGDAVRSLEFVMACNRSMEENQPIAITRK